MREYGIGMRFRSLGSGSTGNAMVVEAGEGPHLTRILVDCGFTQKEVTGRLAQAGLEPGDLSAIFITHEHADHLGCAEGLAKRWHLPLWLSEGTACSLKAEVLPDYIHFARDGAPFHVGALRLHPFTVPHDAREPLQLRIEDGTCSLAILTDIGHPTDYALANISGCSALFLEANHDTAMLRESRYPQHLIRRIAGPLGHLANEASVELLRELGAGRPPVVVAAHLSLQNNRPEIVAESWASVLNVAPGDVRIANAANGIPWTGVPSA